MFEADGTYIGGFGPRGTEDGQLLGASGILLDGEGNAFVFDAGDFAHENFETGSVQMFRLLPPLAP